MAKNSKRANRELPVSGRQGFSRDDMKPNTPLDSEWFKKSRDDFQPSNRKMPENPLLRLQNSSQEKQPSGRRRNDNRKLEN